VHDIASRIAKEQTPQGAPLACPQHDQIAMVTDRLQRDRPGDQARTAALRNRKMMLAQFIAQPGTIIGKIRISGVRAMKQRHLGMEALCQGNQKLDARCPVTDNSCNRRQDVTGVRFTHMYEADNGQIGPDRSQKLVGGLALQGVPVAFAGGQRIEDKIGAFCQNPTRQQAGQCTGF